MTAASHRATSAAFLFSIFCVAVCGLIYELLAATMSTYLLRDSVYQFSIVIGMFVSSMGLGSWLSRFVEKDLADRFIAVELAVGLLGGFSAAILFSAYAVLKVYLPVLIFVSVSLGAMIGLEIPLVLRILKEHNPLEATISNVFTVDYIGALIASLAFPLFLVPNLGLIRTSLLFGLVNVAVAFLGLAVFKPMLRKSHGLTQLAVAAACLLGFGLLKSGAIAAELEARLYGDKIVLSKQTRFQRIVLTQDGPRLSLYLDRKLQFDSGDERQYHESLVHPVLAAARRREKVLILGAGDGLAAREVLKYPDVKAVTLVDIDKAMTDLFREDPRLTALNGGSLSDPRLTVVNDDAWQFLERSAGRWDAVIVDFPDPVNFDVNKLYSVSFYQLLAKRLAADGIVGTQAASPYFHRKSYWSIHKTMGTRWAQTIPYRWRVPSFGEQGFVLASAVKIPWGKPVAGVPLSFLTPAVMKEMLEFPADAAKLDVEVNSIDTHKVMQYQGE